MRTRLNRCVCQSTIRWLGSISEGDEDVGVIFVTSPETAPAVLATAERMILHYDEARPALRPCRPRVGRANDSVLNCRDGRSHESRCL